MFNGGKVWNLGSGHSIDVVLLEVSIDDLYMLSTDIIILNDKMTTHTRSKQDDTGCQNIVPVVLPSDPSLHNMEGVLSVTVIPPYMPSDPSLHNMEGVLSVTVIPPHTITDPPPNLPFISLSPDPITPVKEVQSE